MSDNDMVRVSHKVPKEMRDRAQDKSEYGEMSELVRNIYQKKAYGANGVDREEIDEYLRELRGERDQKRLELRRFTEEMEVEIQDLEVQIARLEERKDKAQSRTDQFEGELGQLVARVENGERVYAEFPGVQRAADTIEETPEYVVGKVREKVPEAPDELFTQGDVNGGGRKW